MIRVITSRALSPGFRAIVATAVLGTLLVFASSDGEAATTNVAVGNPNWFCDASYSMAECPTTVAVGDTVTWNFPGGTYHSTAECRGSTCDDVSPPNPTPLWDSGLHIGGSYSRIFNTPGVYYYQCTFHGYGLMRGRITVSSAVGGEAELPGASGVLAGDSTEASTGGSLLPAAFAALGGAAAVGLGVAWYARRRNLT